MTLAILIVAVGIGLDDSDNGVEVALLANEQALALPTSVRIKTTRETVSKCLRYICDYSFSA